jgi:hypothetical protein
MRASQRLRAVLAGGFVRLQSFRRVMPAVWMPDMILGPVPGADTEPGLLRPQAVRLVRPALETTLRSR